MRWKVLMLFAVLLLLLAALVVVRYFNKVAQTELAFSFVGDLAVYLAEEKVEEPNVDLRRFAEWSARNDRRRWHERDIVPRFEVTASADNDRRAWLITVKDEALKEYAEALNERFKGMYVPP